MELSRSVAGVNPARTWDVRLARLLSVVFSPPLMIVSGAALTAARLATQEAWRWTGIYLLLAVCVPVTYVGVQLARGRISDFDLRVREQRIKPYLVSLFCAALAWLWLRLGMAPALLIVVVGAGVAQVALMLAITLFWKISAHTASVAGVAALAVMLIGAAALPLLALVPLLAWARLRLKRHTLMQTVAGALLGAGLMALALRLGLG
jgi:membrane-associated phospholipid phosphatase